MEARRVSEEYARWRCKVGRKPALQKFDLLAKDPLGEASNSTPAISDGEFFVRTMKGLHCIAQ
jgi:hypothetical protein